MSASPEVAALYLWLEGCAPGPPLESVLREAVGAGDFELFHTASGAGWALAVVGESHVVLHASGASLCAEVVSCSTVDAARRALDVVRRRVPHTRATERLVIYRDGAIKPAAAGRR